jgi:peptidoglycan/LPS O-acetylase OafA/YrhL
MKAPFSSISYMPHLDGVRAVAVTAVLLEHWGSGLPEPIRTIVQTLDTSLWGVECFFVLSGFLITLILLKDKETSASIPTALGHFYTRRVLRIFPAYYLILFLMLFFTGESGGAIFIHGLYLTNLYGSVHNEWLQPGGHFWSLALEEQFYLLWPLIVLTLPIRKLAVISIALCIVAPASRLLIYLFIGEHHLAIFMFPTTALDLLCFGSLIAIVKHESSALDFRRYSQILTRVGLAALIVYLAVVFLARDSLFFAVFGRTISAILFGAFVVNAANGFSGITAKTLGSPMVIWFGMVSYGVYIIHPFIPEIYRELGSYLGFDMSLWGVYYIRYPIMFLAMLAVVALSYYFFERPIRNLKRQFS